jgi:hypothetical protein
MTHRDRITALQAEELLDGRPVASCLSGTLPYIKEVRDKCLAAGIPAIAAAPAPSRG